jgi:ankyrin repeat protein
MGDAAAAEALREASDGFFLAAEFGRSDVIKALADHGRGCIDLAAVVDADTGRSPLHVAVAHGKTDALRVLLAAGFPPDVESHGEEGKDGEGGARRQKRTAYALAQELQAADLVRVFHQFLIQQVAANEANGVAQMLAAGVDVAVTDGASSSSLLHWAVSCQAVDVLADLLQRRDVQEQRLVDQRNCDGATPLHLAAHSNQAECVRLLLAAGADVSLRGEKAFSAGKTAAELTTSPEILELIQQTPAPSSDRAGKDEGSVNGNGIKHDEVTKFVDDDSKAVEQNGHSRGRTSTIKSDKKGRNQLEEGSKHDETTCEHAVQVSKLLLQLEEKDVLINQLKKTIEDLVVEAQEIQKLGEERVMLEYVRKLREERTVVERQLDDANDYIGVQQDQIADLKAQIRRMCDEQQVRPL